MPDALDKFRDDCADMGLTLENATIMTQGTSRSVSANFEERTHTVHLSDLAENDPLAIVMREWADAKQ